MHAAHSSPVIDVIIPALNEERAISKVIADVPSALVRHVIVADNGSTDRTADRARAAGATVVPALLPGYGNACLAALEYLDTLPREHQPEIIVFIDGDYSDHPDELKALITPITEEGMDLVIGSRTLGHHERGALTPQQVLGNALATRLIRIIYGYRFTDLGPFRAIRKAALDTLDMEDRNYGWTVEMQVKAAKLKLKCTEVPVSYRPRIGNSKVSGTVKGSVLAGVKILSVIFKLI